jgi:hypothetical protein
MDECCGNESYQLFEGEERERTNDAKGEEDEDGANQYDGLGLLPKRIIVKSVVRCHRPILETYVLLY